MGTFAHGDVNIIFEKKEDAKKVHDILSDENVKDQFVKFLGEESDGAYTFYGFETDVDDEVFFQYSSGRVQNAEWQVEQIIALLKKLVQMKEIDAPAEFNSSLMMDAGGYYMLAEEFHEE